MTAAKMIVLGSQHPLKATIASGDAVEVRQFRVIEGLSSLFQVTLTVRSMNPFIELEAVAGQPATFSMDRSELQGGPRIFSGVCSSIEQLELEDEGKGVSTYEIVVSPLLWLLTQRRNHRMFQRMSEPEIVLALLDEWGIERDVRLDLGAYKAREYRLQYAETDFAFVSRMLEDAGITYFYENGASGSRLVLSDRPEGAKPREEPVKFVGTPNPQLDAGFATRVFSMRRTRPGRYVQRDWDFRNKAPITTTAEGGLPEETRLERFHYMPNALHFFEGPGTRYPVGDEKGKYRRDPDEGATQTVKRLSAKQGQACSISFSTDLEDLAPGVVFTMKGHSRSDVSDTPLLLTSVESSGTSTGAWTRTCEARSAKVAFHPALVTPKPQVMGLEPATVVGRKGEEIDVDEFGRVHLHFHWDREDRFDDQSSAWIPVSHAWAGAGYGHIDHPRVGQEVLVDFLGGDPDQPIVVGRVYTAPNPVVYPLPKNATKSGFKSTSSPGGEGYNELMLEDRKGHELVRFQAEKDHASLTKNDSGVVVGHDSMSHVGRDQTHTVYRDQTTRVGCHRRLRIENQQSHWVDRDIYQASTESSTTLRSKRGLYQHSNEKALFSAASAKQVMSSLVEEPIQAFISITPELIQIQAPFVDIHPRDVALSLPPKPDPLSKAEKRDWYMFGGPENDGASQVRPDKLSLPIYKGPHDPQATPGKPPAVAKPPPSPKPPVPAKPPVSAKPTASPNVPATGKTTGPREMKNELTEISEPDMYKALEKAWKAKFKTKPSHESLLLLMAQWKSETGGKYMHNFNVGNIKGKENSTEHSWQFFRCNEYVGGKEVWDDRCCFRAYDSLDDGVSDYLTFLHDKYESAWPAVESGDPAEFAHQLKEHGYYTASEASYTKLMKGTFDGLKKRIDENGEAIPPPPPPPPKPKVATPRKAAKPCSGGCNSPRGEKPAAPPPPKPA